MKSILCFFLGFLVVALTVIQSHALRRVPTISAKELGPNQKSSPPNAFLAVHIDDENVLEAVAKLQKALMDVDPRFNSTFEAITSLHVTFDTFYITDEDIQKANEALQNATKAAFEAYGPITIHFEKLAALIFGMNLFAIPDANSASLLTKYDDMLNEYFDGAGLTPSKGTAYAPHMSLSLLSNPEMMHEWDFLLNEQPPMGVANPSKIRLYGWNKDPNSPDYPLLAEANLGGGKH